MLTLTVLVLPTKHILFSAHIIHGADTVHIVNTVSMHSMFTLFAVLRWVSDVVLMPIEQGFTPHSIDTVVDAKTSEPSCVQ